MKDFDKEVEDFLKQFERNANVGSAEEIVEQFADVFMAADPSGARAVPSSKLLMAIPQRKKLFESVGGGATALASVELTRLDDRYVLLKTEWLMKLNRGGGPGEDLTLRSTFVLYRSDDGLKIVFYLNHEDLMSVLRERGSPPPDKP
ncbi:hypothetical protein [Tunturibacter empetritectus]|uniref:Nuclear transport factor 2 family protein n=1 Tax=Tunturiibacter lichenicola TaxID=2051959 RepID=A0A7W8J993_9BACT|nr:hypothetical protein [Edaphobacter lichenicola]MBB5344950.1 hypothetical protein [Edaphobacter lichenicola]